MVQPILGRLNFLVEPVVIVSKIPHSDLHLSGVFVCTGSLTYKGSLCSSDDEHNVPPQSQRIAVAIALTNRAWDIVKNKTPPLRVACVSCICGFLVDRDLRRFIYCDLTIWMFSVGFNASPAFS